MGVSYANVRENTQNPILSKDVWLYKSSNGAIFHDGEILNPLNSLPEFTADDVITVQLDVDEGTLSFGKNNQPLLLAFDDLPSVELFPIVVFNTNNHGEKVQIYDLVKVPKDLPLLCGEPICAPPNETLAQAYLDLLRVLYNGYVAMSGSIYSIMVKVNFCQF